VEHELEAGRRVAWQAWQSAVLDAKELLSAVAQAELQHTMAALLTIAELLVRDRQVDRGLHLPWGTAAYQADPRAIHAYGRCKAHLHEEWTDDTAVVHGADIVGKRSNSLRWVQAAGSGPRVCRQRV
jgi:hypothetical protein